MLIASRDNSFISESAVMLGALHIFWQCLNEGIVIRGGLSYGETVIDLDKNIVFGQPIIDAYELEQKQAWFGIIKDLNWIIRDSKDAASLSEEQVKTWKPIFLNYDVPMKSGASEKYEAINWPLFLHSAKSIKTHLRPFMNKGNPKLEKYYQNTLDFAMHSFTKAKNNYRDA